MNALAGSIPSEQFVQLFCLAGEPPPLNLILNALSQAGLEVVPSPVFGISAGPEGWLQVMFVDPSSGDPVFVEIYRAASSWEGTKVRGDVDQQVRAAMEGLREGEEATSLGRRLARTAFIIAVASPANADQSELVRAVTDYCRSHHDAVVRIDGRIMPLSRRRSRPVS